MKPRGGENADINSSTTLSTRFPFSKSWGAFWLHVFSIFLKTVCFFYGCWLCAPAAHWLSFLVVWAAAACRALLRCMGFPFWSFRLLRLAGRSCGAWALLSGRLGCCGLPGALAVHGSSFLVAWAAAACWALLRCMCFPFWSFRLLRLAGRSCVQQKDFPSI